MDKSFYRIIVLTKRNIKEIFRDPLSIVFTIGLPLLMEILFYFLFHKYTSQFDMKYLAPSIVVFSQSFLALFIGILIANDRNTSFLTRLFVTKTKSIEFIVSYVLSLIPIVLVQSILFFIVGGIIDCSIFSFKMIYSILISVITSIFYLSLGILFGSLCNEGSVGGVASIVISAQSVLSGMWFPLEQMEGGFVIFLNYLPFKNAADLVKNVLNGINNLSDDFIYPLIILLIYIIIKY